MLRKDKKTALLCMVVVVVVGIGTCLGIKLYNKRTASTVQKQPDIVQVVPKETPANPDANIDPNSVPENSSPSTLPTETGTPSQESQLPTEVNTEVIIEEGEGVKLEVGEDITADYQDSTGYTLPLDPREDPNFKEDWFSEIEAVQYMSLPLEEVMMCNTYHFYMANEAVDTNFLPFMEKYLERLVVQASDTPNIEERGYSYTLKILSPEEYPSDYPYTDIKSLCRLEFYKVQ